jgi:2-oxoglutarate ferredoxin oxidoreductase subunit gamma
MNILIAGEGGQGVQTIAESLAYAAFVAGLHSSYLPQFGVEQRGTPSVAFIQIDKKPFANLKFKTADLVIILRERAVGSIVSYVNPHTAIVFDSSTIDHKKLPKNHKELLGIPATAIAKEKFIPRVFNVIVLGAISKLVYDMDKKCLWQALEKYLGKKFVADKKIRELNLSALDEGMNFIFERNKFSRPSFSTTTKEIVNDSNGKKATVIPSLCKGCGICVEKCPVKAISFSDEIGFFGNPVPQVDTDKCIGCQNCSVFCPDTAIKVDVKKK